MNFTKEKINSINDVEVYAVTFINDNDFSITFYTYGGYIHNILIPYKNEPYKFEDVILGYNNLKIKKIAQVYSNITRMGVTYFSYQLGVQFYTGNMMADKYEGKDNRKYGLQYGLCVEPQFFPNAINLNNFNSPIVRVNQQYIFTILMKLNNNF